MNCHQFSDVLDSYIGDELLVETNHDVLRHLEDCRACREDLAARRSLRTKLRSAVRNAPDSQIDSVFARALRRRLSENGMRSRWVGGFSFENPFHGLRSLMAVAAGIFLVAFIGFYVIKHQSDPAGQPLVAENQPVSIDDSAGPVQRLPASSHGLTQSMQIGWQQITDIAIGDHKNCALKFNLKERPISLIAAAKKYEKYNRDLDKAVANSLRGLFPASTQGDIKLVEAHSCVFEGKRFAHIVLRRQGHTISVLVTDSDPQMPEGEAIISDAAGDLQAVHVKTKNHAVFVISDMTEIDNQFVAQNVIPAIKRHLDKFEV
ncbi:MAG: hypothetical protein ABIO91_09055 [Pyrinomonadaceae bacterium]